MNDLILHPEYESLQKEIARLKDGIVIMHTRIDRAKMVEGDSIWTEYTKCFGRFELELAQKYYKFRLLKRRMELIRSYLNRGTDPDMDVVEKVLEMEGAEYNEILRKKSEELKRAAATTFTEYTAEEAAHAKKLYQGLVRALHPDLHPDATSADIACLQQAVEAYASGDLATLEAIAVVVECGAKKEAPPSTLDALRERCAQYRKTLDGLTARLHDLRGKFPFTLREHLSSPQKILARVMYFREELQKLDRRIEVCEMQLRQMNGAV